MTKSNLIISLVFSLFVSECFAMDYLPTVMSGEVTCHGGKNNAVESTYVFRNYDPAHPVSFTKISLYQADNGGAELISFDHTNFPPSLKESIAPNEALAISTSDESIVAKSFTGRLIIRASFKSTHDQPMIALQASTSSRNVDKKGNLVSRSVEDCDYTQLKR